MFRWFILAFVLGISCETFAQARVSGKVTDRSAYPLAGVLVYEESGSAGTATDTEGNFVVELPAGKHKLRISYLGFITLYTEVLADTTLNIVMEEELNQIKELTVKAEKPLLKLNERPSSLTIQGASWKGLPSFAGESDIVGVFQLMPGVKKGGDANAGMLVRGGSPDQNLLLLDGIPVYQAGHLISFYSLFQPELIKEATLHKGAMPSQLGGRLSSVLDVHTRKGNPDSLSAEIGLGMVLVKASLQGPLFSKRLTYSAGIRRSIPDLLWPLAGQSFPAAFHDGHVRLDFDAGKGHRLRLSYFNSNDNLHIDAGLISKYKPHEKGLIPDLQIGSGAAEQHLALAWNVQGGNARIWENLVYASSHKTDNRASWQGNKLGVNSCVRDLGVKSIYSKKTENRESIAGSELVFHFLGINGISSNGDVAALIPERDMQSEAFAEWSLFVQQHHRFSSRFRADAGIRGTVLLNGGEPVIIPQPSLSIQYDLSTKHSVFAGVQRSAQFIHRLSNSSTALPTDTWYPSSQEFKPQTSVQYQLGWRMSERRLRIESEVYYKSMNSLVEYREGAIPLQSAKLSKELVQGKGRGWGSETMIRFEGKHYSLWASYTLAWSYRQFDELNKGKQFFARFDRRHDVTLTGRYRFDEYWSVSGVFNWASGARITPRVGQFLMPGIEDPGLVILPIFGERNSFRLSSVHRVDLSLSYSARFRRCTAEFQFGAYNVYNQLQPFRLEMLEKNGKLIFRETGLFGMVPSLSVTIRF